MITLKGIRLEDIPELLSVCACSIEDEIIVTELSNRVVQFFFEKFRNSDIDSISDITAKQFRQQQQQQQLEEEDEPVHVPLSVDYYGRLTKTPQYLRRTGSIATRLGLPMPTDHLKYLQQENREEPSASGSVGGEGSSQRSLFLGGQSMWSESTGEVTKAEEALRGDGHMTAAKFLNLPLLRSLQRMPKVSQDQVVSGSVFNPECHNLTRILTPADCLSDE